MSNNNPLPNTNLLRNILSNLGQNNQQPQNQQLNQPQLPQPQGQLPVPQLGLLRNIVSNIGRQNNRQDRVNIPDPDVFRSEVLADSDRLTQMLHEDPMMAEAVLAEDRTLLRALLEERVRAHQQREAEENRLVDQLNSNPYDEAAQLQIEKRIQEENVSKNMEAAIEHIPESFGSVVMLYIPCSVNGIQTQVFVDSGAQITIMSVDFATKCNIMRLVDKRFAGMAQGVGTAPIVGRVHLAQIKIGTQFYPFSITVIDGKKGVEFLLGLDMLRRHQCLIDLKQNGLHIGGELVPFLGEGEILEYKNEKEESNAMDQDLPKSDFPEEAIKELQEIGGFTRQQVIEALTVSNGDKQRAASFLLS